MTTSRGARIARIAPLTGSRVRGSERAQTQRRCIKIDFYDPARIPGADSLEGTEWKECARWVVMFGLEFAEAFAVKPYAFDLAG